MAFVLVVRQPDIFSQTLAESGLKVINCPTIRTKELEDLSDLETKLAAVGEYDGIFLTSSAAAGVFLRKWREKERRFSGRLYVLGRSSFDLLSDQGFDIVFDRSANTAREMIGSIPEEAIAGRRFLFIRGERSMGTISELLSQTAEIDETIVYRTCEVPVDPELRRRIEAAANQGELKCVCFFSPSGVESFLKQFGSGILSQTKVAGIGKTTANYLSQHKLCADFTAKKATTEDFAAELIEFLADN